MICMFDFDGTLVDTRKAYYEAVRVYANKHHLSLPTTEEMNAVFGNPNPPLIFTEWGNGPIFKMHLDHIYEICDKLIDKNPQAIPMFEGVHDILEEIKLKEIALALITSRSLQPVLSVMHHYEILPLFKTIRSAQDMIDSGYRGKPFPDKLNSVLKETSCAADQAVMVRDTSMDIEMAQGAGVKSIAVSWGYRQTASLAKSGPSYIVETMLELKQAIFACLEDQPRF